MDLEKKNEDLMSALARMSHCDYISDLHSDYRREDIRKAVEAADCADYSLREWNDAARYLAQRELRFDTAREAKAYLLALLSL